VPFKGAVQGCWSEIVSAALGNQSCQWEQDSADAAATGRLSHALMMMRMAVAAQLLTSITASEISNVLSAVLDVQRSEIPPLEDKAEMLSSNP
jgi:hypothetical protein